MISGYSGTGDCLDMRGNYRFRIIIVDYSAGGTGPTTCEFEHSDTTVCYDADPYHIPESLFIIEPEYKTYDRPPKTIKAKSASVKNHLTILKQPVARMGFKRGQRK